MKIISWGETCLSSFLSYLILYCAILFWCPVHLIPLSQTTCHLDFLFIMSLQNPQSFIKLHTVITAYILHHTTNVLGHHMGHHQHQTLSQRYVKCFLYRRYTVLQIGTVIQRHIDQKGKSFLLGTICMFYRNVSLATCTYRFISGWIVNN